jgi:hypothetical protein
VCGAFVSLAKESTVTEPEETITTAPRRRAPGADPVVRSFGSARTCAADDCETRLSRYNPDSYCSVHRGWDRQVVTRRRRAEDEDEEG